MNRKYLDDIGDTARWDNCWGEPGDELSKSDQQFLDEYGVNPREVFNLDTAFFEWLYERVMAYENIAENFVKLDTVRDGFRYQDHTYSQRELMHILIDKLKAVLDDGVDYDAKLVKEICTIWGELLPAMWY